MKVIFIVGIMVLLLSMVGSASAETLYLTDTDNSNNYGVPIKVQVDYTGNTMHVKLLEPQNKAYGNCTISNVDLTNIWLKTTGNHVTSVSSPWALSDNICEVGGFGLFKTQITNMDSSFKSAGPVDIILEDNVSTLMQNNDNYIIAVQVSFRIAGNETEVIDPGNKIEVIDPGNKTEVIGPDNKTNDIFNHQELYFENEFIKKIFNVITFGLFENEMINEDNSQEIVVSERSIIITEGTDSSNTGIGTGTGATD
ncbi:MAG TPA: hypothetical protein HA261_14235, partial [Methanosarcina sp.]|nr:hypothetical protein [Methanosarcina sp.]